MTVKVRNTDMNSERQKALEMQCIKLPVSSEPVQLCD